MSTWKSARRAAVALTLVVCSVALVTGADREESPSPASSSMVNSVVIESQTHMIGTPGTTVGISISNTSPIVGLVIPLEIRPVTPGTAIAQTIFYQMNPTGRVANSPLGVADTSVDSLWPEAFRTVRQSCVVCSVACSGPTSSSYCASDTSCSFPTTPYGLFFGTVSRGDPELGEEISLPAGADPGTAADASLQIVLTQMGSLPGFFEIDTACWVPANHIAYSLPNTQLVFPSFTKGVIELRCDCSCHADPICDGIMNIQDVVQSVDVVFRNEDPGTQPFCPRNPVDADCDGFLNIVDVVSYIDVAFRNADPSTVFCDPCAL